MFLLLTSDLMIHLLENSRITLTCRLLPVSPLEKEYIMGEVLMNYFTDRINLETGTSGCMNHG